MATNVDAKLLKQTKFPADFSQKVDMRKVNVEVMKKWIAGKISEILGSEDDVVIELCFNLLEGSRFPDIKVLQIQLTGFLDKDTPKFCKELWTLCLSAQSNPQGVPKELLEAKKLELIQEKVFQILPIVEYPGLTPRKPPKRRKGAMSKNGHGREILIIFGRGSGLSEDEAVAVETEHITTTIDVLPETRGPRLRGAVRHRTGMTTVDRHAVILLTPTYLVIEVNDDTKAGAGHHHRDDRPVGLCPARRHLQDDVNMMTRDQEDTVTVPAGLQHRYAEAAEGLESKTIPKEAEPSRRTPQSQPSTKITARQAQGKFTIIIIDLQIPFSFDRKASRGQRQIEEISGEAITTVGVEATVAVDVQFTSQLNKPRAEAPALQGSEKERDIGR
ncbi:MAG: hypothetical protein L6R39_005632 [Caloplaca ligustica]|nr:MAG: hypothetical protein L6R39_005632 [Caloplaca ligustica]